MANYHADFLDLDDDNCKCFVSLTYDRDTGEWAVFKKQWKCLISVAVSGALVWRNVTLLSKMASI